MVWVSGWLRLGVKLLLRHSSKEHCKWHTAVARDYQLSIRVQVHGDWKARNGQKANWHWLTLLGSTYFPSESRMPWPRYGERYMCQHRFNPGKAQSQAWSQAVTDAGSSVSRSLHFVHSILYVHVPFFIETYLHSTACVALKGHPCTEGFDVANTNHCTFQRNKLACKRRDFHAAGTAATFTTDGNNFLALPRKSSMGRRQILQKKFLCNMPTKGVCLQGLEGCNGFVACDMAVDVWQGVSWRWSSNQSLGDSLAQNA